MGRDRRRFYQFALYGRSGSGKSCLLGALALAGESIGLSGRLFTCERLPYEGPDDGGNEGFQSNDDSDQDNGSLADQNVDQRGGKSPDGKIRLSDEEKSLLHGKRWMDTVCESLERRKPVPATPPDIQPPPAVEFRIGDPQMGEFFVRIIDYSGELINPNAEGDPESLAAKLKQRLTESDGLLILAEVPSREKRDQFFKEFRLLREAFHSLKHRLKNAPLTPVGILVNKWDRYTEIDFNKPDGELDKLDNFLKEHREHSSLIESIKSAFVDRQQSGEQQPDPSHSPDKSAVITEQRPVGHSSESGGFDGEPVLVAPVSAFGKAIFDPIELPAEIPPRPFNALEPFVWLANRRDERELTETVAQWQRLSKWWWAPLWFWWRGVRRLKRNTDRMSLRMPQQSPHRPPLLSLKRSLMGCLVLSIVCSLLYLIAFSDLAVSTWHVREYVLAREAVNNQGAAIDDLASYRATFESWVQRPYTGLLRALLVPESSRSKILQAINERLDQILYARFKDAPGAKEKNEAAKEYLSQLPAGPHSTECQTYIDELAWQDRLRENVTALDILKAEWPKEELGDPVRRYRERVDSFQWPHPDAVTSELSDQLQLFKQQIATWYLERTMTDLAKRVSQLLEAGQITQAVQEVLIIPPDSRSANWVNTAQGLAQHIPVILEHKSANYIKMQKFDDALQEIDVAIKALKDLEVASRSSHSAVADEALQSQQRVASIRRTVAEEYDRTLYNAVRELRSKQACEQYLRRAPVRSMEKDVKAYYDYLTRLEQPLDLVIRVIIRWDPNYEADGGKETGENYISIFVNNKRVLHVGPKDQNEVQSDIGTFAIRAQSGQALSEIFISIVEDDWGLYGFDDDAGSGGRRVSMQELREGVTIPLRGPGFENAAVLKVEEGWPSEPELPSWIR
mgnify:CR=1 FL=1